MANIAAVTVPLENIQRVQVYINEPRKTLAQIKRETGADYLINGTLYNMRTGAVNCHLKVDGKVIASPAYTVAGYAWNTGSDFGMDVLPTVTRNYIACTPLIVSGTKLSKLTYDPGQGGQRGRTAIGIKKGRLCLYCTKDGTASARTPEKLRDDLHAAGWESAVMLDGGGSSQCDLAGQVVTSSRKVQHLVLVYLKKNDELEPEGGKPMVEINAYSKKKDGSKKLSTNFTVKEFACKNGEDTVLVAPRLVMVLQSIRSHFGKAVTINSAYRTPEYNRSKAVGGVDGSQHCYGTAADIVVKGVTPAKVAAYARSIMPDWGGVGTYGKFTHVDVRETKSDWKG